MLSVARSWAITGDQGHKNAKLCIGVSVGEEKEGRNEEMGIGGLRTE